MEIVEVDFQTGEKHQIENAHLAKQFEGDVQMEEPQSVFANHDAGKDQSGDVRQAQARRKQRRDQQQRHDQRKIENEAVGIHGENVSNKRRNVQTATAFGRACDWQAKQLPSLP